MKYPPDWLCLLVLAGVLVALAVAGVRAIAGWKLFN